MMDINSNETALSISRIELEKAINNLFSIISSINTTNTTHELKKYEILINKLVDDFNNPQNN